MRRQTSRTGSRCWPTPLHQSWRQRAFGWEKGDTHHLVPPLSPTTSPLLYMARLHYLQTPHRSQTTRPSDHKPTYRSAQRPRSPQDYAYLLQIWSRSTSPSGMPSLDPGHRAAARGRRRLQPETSDQALLLREAVRRNIGQPWASRLLWSRCKIPTISNIDILRDCPLFAHGLGSLLLHDTSRRTAFEQPGASWAEAIAQFDRDLPNPCHGFGVLNTS